MNIDKSILAELKAEQKPKRTKLQSERNYYYRAFSKEVESLIQVQRNLGNIREVMATQALDAYDPVTNEIDKARQEEFNRAYDDIDTMIKDLSDINRKYGRLHHDFPEFNEDLQ